MPLEIVSFDDEGIKGRFGEIALGADRRLTVPLEKMEGMLVTPHRVW